MVTLTTGLGDGRPVLIVADQGPGFTPVRAAGGAPAEGPESHGMGLAFVRAILKRHGATMTVADGRPGAVVTARFSR